MLINYLIKNLVITYPFVDQQGFLEAILCQRSFCSLFDRLPTILSINSWKTLHRQKHIDIFMKVEAVNGYIKTRIKDVI